MVRVVACEGRRAGALRERKACPTPAWSPPPNKQTNTLQSTYTGVYAKGGPTNVDSDPSSLASVCDRSPADARGVKVASAAGSRRATAEQLIAAARRSTGERK